MGIVFSLAYESLGHITNFDDNLEDLKNTFEDLRASRDDVLRKVEAEERKGWQRLDGVERWLLKVQVIETETNLLVAEASQIQDRLSRYGYCSNYLPVYSCGKKIPKMLDEVKMFLSREYYHVVAAPSPLPVVLEKPVVETFGLATKIESTWSRLLDADIRMLGLYGMGGVGKTTLLKLINNKLFDVQDRFDVVIWVNVSKDADIDKIQDTIAEGLGLCDLDWSTYSKWNKASQISRVLAKRKPRFVLLLDDLWEEVSLTAIGVPLQGREYKVVFTTRSKDVCGRMGANEDIEVECLADKDAWDLFKQKARCEGLNDEISNIAKEIAATCHGLPLALDVIGKAMASKTTVDEWRRALEILKSYPSEWKDTEEGIFQVLKLSYDHLEEAAAKLCFQYCALFPETYNIKREELVDYWIGEGFIDEEHGRQRAVHRGYELIDTLVGSSLLSKDGESEQRVYMHNMIREMALWIVSKCRDGERFVVITGAGLIVLPNINNLRSVTKMSLINNEIQSIHFPLLPNPDRLATLFLQNNKLVDISGKFFQVLSRLVVLDLSHNPDLTELPQEISILVALRYLSLLGTRIKNLQGLKGLIKLIHLDLESTSNLQSLGAISGLLKLQVLRFYNSAAALDLSLLKDLERLGDLQLLTITVREVGVLEGFFGSKLVGKTHGLYLQGINLSGKSFAATFGALGSLSKFGMEECDIIESATEWEDNGRSHFSSPSTSSNPITPSNTWFKNLSAVVLLSCEGLKDVTWLIYASNLESLTIKTSPNMKEVISQKKAEGVNVEKEPFRKLQVLDLGYLGELKSIFWTSLLFPKLKKVNITECPNLRKLPVNSTSVYRIDDLRVQVDEGWLDGVEWEIGAEERFRPIIRTASTV